MKRPQIITFTVLVLTILVLGTAFFIRSQDNTGLRQIKSYNTNGVCQSVNDPACGNCPGKITDDKCYVKKGTFDQYY
jgi:hypothetical protein